MSERALVRKTLTVNMVPQRRESILMPVAYSELCMPSLQLARSSRLARGAAKVLFILLLVSICVMIFAPWQQTVTGSGNVVAYAPRDRQQTLEAPIKGRIVRWGDGIVENSRVSKGQLIAEIQDLDPSMMTRLEAQLSATRQQVQSAREQVAANRRNAEAARTIVESYAAQVTAYNEVKLQLIASADALIDNAQQKVIAEEQHLAEHAAALMQIEADYRRQKQLYDERIVSQLKFQEAERKYKEAVAKVAKQEAYLQAAKDELVSKERDRDAKAQKAQVDVDYATAIYRKSQGDVAKAEGDVSKAEAEWNKAEKELLDLQVKVAQQESRLVTAPFDGFVVQIAPNQGGQMLKEGDPLCTMVPDTTDRAVQLWVRGNDVPLISPGRHVRLQFEGWPMVQFSGWPLVAVGTFGGEVVSVDSTDNGNGQFRILVRPESSEVDRPGVQWPDGKHLRQGVRANGWVLLNRVPLWFEVWRRMNAFPPSIPADAADKDKTSKPPKVAKAP